MTDLSEAIGWYETVDLRGSTDLSGPTDLRGSRNLLEASHLRRAYGGVTAVDDVTLRIPAGGRWAITGPNGAGKTTLLNLVAGLVRPDSGRVLLDGRDATRLGPAGRARLGIGRTHQCPAVWSSLSSLENVLVAAAHPGAREPRGALVERCRALLDAVDLADGVAVPAGALSHGQRRQLELAIALAGRPRLLLLDEPAAGLSQRELDRLVPMLAGLPRTMAILMVEHRMDVVEALADRVLELRDGRGTSIRTVGPVTSVVA